MHARQVIAVLAFTFLFASDSQAGTNCGPNRLPRFAALQNCFSGSEMPANGPNCGNFDADGDLDVDLPDHAAFLKPMFGTDVYPIAANLRAAALADLDADGDTDLVVTGVQVYVLRNQGDGTFVGPAIYPAGVTIRSPAIADLDGDGDPDIVLADLGSSNLWVLLNAGNGTFGAAINIAVSGPTASVAAADFDGDQDVDLAATRAFNTEAFALKNQGNLSFVFSANLLGAASSKISMTAADLNGDGHPDLAAIAQPHDVVRWLNDGAGNFSGTTHFAGDSLAQLAIGDLDGDSDPDVALAMLPYVSVIRNDGSAVFSYPAFYFMGGDIVYLVSLALADLDGDGDLDVATANQPANSVLYTLNDGSAMFSAGTGVPSGASTRWVVSGDLDGDGDPDLAAVNESTVTVLLNGCTP